MSTKKSTRKRINWPPRLIRKRKQALLLLEEWVTKRIEVEYAAGAGVVFTGTISEFNIDDRRTSFLFRNDFGVHAMLSTDLYELVEVIEIPGLPISINFNRKSTGFHDGFSLKPKDKLSEKDLAAVYVAFRQWERLGTVLRVHAGDDMRITMSRSKVMELSDKFMFTVADTEMAHIVIPERSSLVHVETKGNLSSVVLFNDKSHTHFVATDGLESPEAVIDRFIAQTTRLQ